MPRKVANPHDSLFQLMMSRPDAARDFFDLHLPKEIKSQIDWSSLRQAAQVYTDGVDKGIVDALYSAKIAGQEAYILLLTEHQSTSQRLMPLRLFEYMLRIARDWLDKHGHHAKLPTIYPLIFHTDTKKYRHTTDFWELFQDPTLAKQIYLKPFQVIELLTIPDEDLKAHPHSGLTEYLMKHRQDSDIVDSLRAVPELLNSASQDTEYFKALMCYTLDQTDSEHVKEIMQLFGDRVDPKSKEEMMTIAERLRQQGRQEGRQQGRQEGMQEMMTIAERLRQQGRQEGMQQGGVEAKKEVAKTLLNKGYTQALIVEITGLTQEQIADVAKSLAH